MDTELPFVVLAAVLVLLLPRKWTLIPFFFAVILLPLQPLVIGGFHFYPTRLLLPVGLLRLVFQSRNRAKRAHSIDKVVILWVVSSTVLYTLLWQSSDAFFYRCAQSFDTLGVYFLVSRTVDNIEDIKRVIRTLLLICIILSVAMLAERATGRNSFAILGGVPLISEIRDGRLRCQGPFLSPILAGSFGAMGFPLFISLYRSATKREMLAVFGGAAAIIVAYTSASSGPGLAFLAGFIGLCMWPFRKSMRPIRWGIAFGVAGLQLIMKAPVWALIGRMHVVSGSDAYHRQVLIDQFIRRFGEWWLLGTRNTEGWSASFLILHDVTNHFIRTAADGGLLTLILFISVIALCFRAVGRVRKAFEGRPEERLSWGLGVCLFVNVVSFMGVSYFDQILVVWYALLALISVLSTLTVEEPASANEPRADTASPSFRWGKAGMNARGSTVFECGIE
jgi:hypothetical protein